MNSFSHLLFLPSGNISLNLSPVHQDMLQCLNEWNAFKNRDLHFIHLNINSLLFMNRDLNFIHLNSLFPKIKELCYIAKSTNAAIIGILRCDRNRQGGGIACYVKMI